MGIRDWFKTQERLITERDYAWHTLDYIRDIIENINEENLVTIKTFISTGKDVDPPRISLSSNLDKGELLINHWGIKAVALSFIDLLNAEPQAINHMIIPLFNEKTGERLEIIIQREGMLTLHEKAKKLELEVAELKKKLGEKQ